MFWLAVMLVYAGRHGVCALLTPGGLRPPVGGGLKVGRHGDGFLTVPEINSADPVAMGTQQ